MILTEQVRVIYGVLGQSSAMTLILSVFAALVLRDLGTIIWIWLAVQIALKLAEFAEMRWFYDAAKVGDNPHGYLVRLCLTQSVHAVGWASLMWIAVLGASPFQMVFATMTLSGVLSGAITNYGALPRVHAAYVGSFILVNLAAFVHLLTRVPSNPYYYSLPLLQILYGLGTHLNTRSSGDTYRRHITLSFANAELARSLSAEITLTDDARREAERAQREAEAANAAKTTFLASASHDLRQPIHAAGLFMALLGNSRLGRHQRTLQASAVTALKASAEMLDTLLDFSRAEAGVIVPQTRAFAIDDIFSGIEDELGVQADDKGIVFRVRESRAWVDSDPVLVRMILLNLAGNALRYTAQGGVLLASRKRRGLLRIEVWDTGIGVAPEHREAIFDEFAQIANPERDRRKGLGLGLAIARRMTRLIGSEVTVQSRLGRGSVFRFDLPLADAHAARLPAPAFPDGAPVTRPGTRCHILLLDDDALILQGLSSLLIGEGYSVALAETLEDALAQAAHRPPDLLICDYRLRKGHDGTEAAQLLRAEHGAGLPVILITGDTHPDRIASAARDNLEVLYKPVDPARIVGLVRTLVPSMARPG